MEEQVTLGRRKLEEAQAEKLRLGREGRELQEQLVEALREASRGGERLLEAFEGRSEAQQRVARLSTELAQAREQLGEVSEALAEEQAQACALRCRMREVGLMPPLIGHLEASNSSERGDSQLLWHVVAHVSLLQMA